jgi:hypothetical protein
MVRRTRISKEARGERVSVKLYPTTKLDAYCIGKGW